MGYSPIFAAETNETTQDATAEMAARLAADGVDGTGPGFDSPTIPGGDTPGDTTVMMVRNEVCAVTPVRRTLAEFAPAGADLTDSHTRWSAMIQAILAGPTDAEQEAGLATGLDRQARLHSLELVTSESIIVRFEVPPGPGGRPKLTEHQLRHFGDQVQKALQPEGVRGLNFQVWDSRVDKFIRAMDLFREQGDDPIRLALARNQDSHIPEPKLDESAARQALITRNNLPTEPGPGNGGALNGVGVVLNPGHGWLYDHLNATPRWRVQRGKLWENLEDFGTAETFMHFLIPALLNAGARVQPVREVDSQTNMVIVDNAEGAPNYVETGSWSTSTANGFVMRTGASWVGTLTNPWGTASATRFANAVTGTATATATYTLNVPATGFYNVYISYSASTNRTTQAHWQVKHSGGTTPFRVNQQRDGATWVLLGNFHFIAGSPATQRQVVVLNDAPGGGVVTCDAVRIGGGMGDMDRRSAGISGQPRWQEEACSYLQFTGMLASTLMSGDSTAGSTDEQLGWGNRPQFANWEQSRDNEGTATVYLGWHTNAFNGGCVSGADNSGTARGSGVFRDVDGDAIPGTVALATAMNTAFVNGMRQIYGQTAWQDRGITASNSYGESSQGNLGGVAGVFFEALFHDNTSDMNVYRDPKMREVAARALVQALITYYGGTVFPPETPVRPRIRSLGNGQARVEWAAGPVRATNLPYGSAATTYRVYTSTNGYGFDNGTDTAGQAALTISAPAGQIVFVQIRAVNSAGVSFPTETLAVRTPAAGQTPVLVVNGYNRNDRFLAPLVPSVSGCADNLVRRLDPRLFNSKNYIIQHADALGAANVAFDNASEPAVDASLVSLTPYRTVVWCSGQEAEADTADPANDTAVKTNSRTAIQNFLQNGGNLFLSGSEVAWNFGRTTGPTDAERTWLTTNLRATLAADSAGVYTATPAAGQILATVGQISIDNGTAGTYNVRFPDVLTAQPGAVIVLNYGSAGANGVAAVFQSGPIGTGVKNARVLFMGFPFETITQQSTRRAFMAAVMQALGESPGSVYNLYPTSDGWSALGQSGALLTSDIGSRSFDGANTALAATLAASPRGRIIGWVESQDNDIPYSVIGTRFVRAKYSVFYNGPGDSGSSTLANRVPNFRLSLRSRGAVTTQLEINHNSQTGGSPAHLPVTREIGPSKSPTAPSLYRVDFDPPEVPYLTGSTTEGIQRGFETLVSGADYSFVSGTLSVTDSTIGTYPAPSLAGAAVKTFAATGTANNSDFDNPGVVTARLGYNASELFRYVAGPSASDYFNPTILSISVNSEANLSVAKSPAGITINSTGLATNRIGVADAAFVSGVLGDTAATRLRVESDRYYVVSLRIKHGGASNTTPFTRFNARTLGFGYNATLELLGARGLPDAAGRSALAQVMPGSGNSIPGSTADGSVYNLVFPSPIHGDIRADIPGNLSVKFPSISAQPGPGANSDSLRDINFGFTVTDSLSFVSGTATDSTEVANGLNLNRIEVRSFPQFAD